MIRFLMIAALTICTTSIASAQVTQQDVDTIKAQAVGSKNIAVNGAESAETAITNCQSLIDSIEILGNQLVYDGCLESYETTSWYTALQVHEANAGEGGEDLNSGDSLFEDGENGATLQERYDAYFDANLKYTSARDEYLFITSTGQNPNGHIGILEEDLEDELARLEELAENCAE